MTPQRSGLKLALSFALESADVDVWLRERSDGGDSLRTIAADVSEILGQEVSHTAISKWLNAAPEAAA